jgi:malate dehydrogenase (oxaloacetate-decarboxylating)(NADP+)
MATIRKRDALRYHNKGRPGKVEVVATKPCLTQFDLSLAYTPGVAHPCREIAATPDDVYKYTSKGNLVAVISNGTAVLGLGNIGPAASKPVMEGKGILFKRFADIDVFDIEIDSTDPEEFVRVVRAMAPTFGGINLEDIKAPECFYIEEKLKKALDIPVFHDDQHGTAIISAAGMLNAAELAGKEMAHLKVVICGAGAAGIACANHYIACGVRLKNILLTDTKGVIYKGRTEGMNRFKQKFARATEARTLADAMDGADVFVGLSTKGMVTKAMVASMAKDPIIFAMANPDPEISYDKARSVRDDLIMGTGRSDFPNQVNNVLGFPFIFRGALDVRACNISEGMKMAATHALAALAKEEVPDQVSKAYGGQRLHFGRDYIIPKPFDFRVLTWAAPAVAKAACDEGLAAQPITDWDAYRWELEKRIYPFAYAMRKVYSIAKNNPKRIVFPEGDNPKILLAAQHLLDEKMAMPILLGRRDRIAEVQTAYELELSGAEIIDPMESPEFEHYAQAYMNKFARNGVTSPLADVALRSPVVFGLMMVEQGHADGFVAGVSMSYVESLRPALKIIGRKRPESQVMGLCMVVLPEGIRFFADTTVTMDPTAEELAQIACQTARFAKSFGVQPKVAMLSFANFGASPSPQTSKVRKAADIAREWMPDLIIDGEMQVDVATDRDIAAEIYPFSRIQGDANVFVFPSLEAANIGYKILGRMGSASVIGPVLLGLAGAVNILAQNCDVESIVDLSALSVIKAQHKKYDL